MNWAVVMTGGKGTRFWPESRTRCPKPFLKLLGGRTLLEETVNRLAPLFPPSRIVIVLQDFLVPKAGRLFPRIPRENFLGEPVGRNTAPCCVWAASHIARRDPAAKIVFLPSDQFIRPKSLYLKTLQTAFEIVDERPVLLGMVPDSPQTGYGWLEVSRKKKKIHGLNYFSVTRFSEKPSLTKARRFLKKGNYLWNGGTFIWRLDSFKRAIQKFEKSLEALLSVPRWQPGTSSNASLNRIYRRLPSISLDYAVMEKMRNVHCLQVPFEWNDLGGWAGLAQLWPSDSHQNRVKGEALLIKSQGNIVKANKRLIALLGVRGLVVIDTEDALLVCPRSEVERIRDVVSELERRRAFKYL